MKYLLAMLLLCGMAFAQGSGACPSGMNSAWTCSDGLGDGSNSEVGLYYHGNLSMSGGILTFTETNTPSRTISGFSASADQPIGSGTTCSGSGNPGNYTCTGNYIGGRIVMTSFNQQYGDWQIKARLSYGWPAIWLLQNAGGTNNCQANYVAGGSGDIAPNCSGPTSGSAEIDIAEGGTLNSGSTVIAQNGYLTAYNNTSPNIQSAASGLSDVTANFHVYEVVITNTTLTFKVDGTTTATRSTNYNANFFLMINMAAFGGTGGNPASYSYPNTGAVDWVKVCSSACDNGITAAAAGNGTFFDDFTGSSQGRQVGGGHTIRHKLQ